MLEGEAAPSGCTMVSLSDKVQVHMMIKVRTIKLCYPSTEISYVPCVEACLFFSS